MATFNINDRWNFLSSVLSEDLLEDAVDWISGHLRPDEVFDKDELEDWAENNGYIKE